jgi:predicted transcriptional regulator
MRVAGRASLLRRLLNVTPGSARLAPMTKLLDEAVRKVRQLPEAEQDAAAEMLLSVASRHQKRLRLPAATRAAIQEGREQARRGEFVNDADMVRLFKRSRRTSRSQ